MNRIYKTGVFLAVLMWVACINSMAQGMYNSGAKIVVTSGTGIFLYGANMSYYNQAAGTNGTLELAGNFNLQGSWYNNTTAILDLSALSGKVTFYGTDTQVISHSSTDKYTRFYNLSLNTAAIVKVPPAKAVSVTNNFVTTGGTFILKSDSAHGTASMIDKNGGSATVITAERWIRGRLGYHFISSPVKDSPTDSIWSNNSNYWFQYYDESVRSDSNRDAGWIRAFPGQIMPNGKAYSCTYFHSNTRHFYNEIISGDPAVTVTLKNITGSILSDDPNGWNLIGNPFPCAIDGEKFLYHNADTTNSIDGALYFWDDVNGNINRNDDYAIFNLSGATAARGNPGNAPNGMIAIGQGFFVHKHATALSVPPYPALNGSISSTVTFYRRFRVHEFTTQFFVPAIVSKQKLWLDVIYPDKDLFNEILVACLIGATDAADISYDAKKLKGNTEIALYSILNQSEYAIQGLPPLNGERKSIQLGLDVTNTGNYFFRPTFDNFNDANQVYLEDKLEKKMINLRNITEYDFSVSTAGSITNRFVLWFNPDLSSVPENNTATVFNVWNNNGKVIVNVGLNKPFSAVCMLFDMAGKELYNQKITVAASGQIDLGYYARGCYLIRIAGNEVNYVQKLIIR